MTGVYETSRDNHRECDCWQVKNNTCSPHFHSSLELTYVVSGSLTGFVNGQRYALAQNEILLCPQYSLHYFTSPQPSLSIVLTVPTDFIPSFQKQLRTHSFAAVTASLSPRNELLHCLRRLSAAPVENLMLRKGYTYAVMGLLTEVLGLQPLKSSAGENLSREILLYLQECFLSPVTVESTAEHFGYSRGHFSHLFSKTFGFTFCEYLNILRCRHAAVLLLNQSCGLLEVALACGYDSIRTFYRNFKRVFGVTPTQYLARRASAQSGETQAV